MHELKFSDEKSYDKKIEPIEEKNKEVIEFKWTNINDLDKNNFQPKVLVNIIKENNGFKHAIERKKD